MAVIMGRRARGAAPCFGPACARPGCGALAALLLLLVWMTRRATARGEAEVKSCCKSPDRAGRPSGHGRDE